MNFGKAKKILIFLFAFLNLFLIFQLSFLSDSRTTVTSDSINKTISLVYSRGLTVKEDIIPRKIEILSFLELSNPLFLGEQFVSDFSSYEKIETDKTLKISFSPTPLHNDKEILKFLNKSGFSEFSLKFNNKISNPISGESIYSFQQSYNNHPIYGSSLNATLNKDNLYMAEGNVYKINNVKINNYNPVSPLQILLTLSRSLNGKKAEVTDISQGYYIPPESKNYQNLTAVPCYILSLKNESFLFDAEKGEFLMCLIKDGGEIYDISVAVSNL